MSWHCFALIRAEDRGISISRKILMNLGSVVANSPMHVARSFKVSSCRWRYAFHSCKLGPKVNPVACKRPTLLQSSLNNAGPVQTEEPSFDDGVNWYCYTIMGLIFLTDFTPLGSAVRSAGSQSLAALAGIQWGAFFVPTTAWALSRKWQIGQLLLGRSPPSTTWMAAGLIGGVALYYLVTAAIAAKAGLSLSDLPALALPTFDTASSQAIPAAVAAAAAASTSSPAPESLIGLLAPKPANWQEFVQLWALTALSPAVCEEFLFRGFLLQAVQVPRKDVPEAPCLGRIDAAFLTGALFAAAHLDLPNFFSLSVLGIACGGLALASGSVLPPMLMHTAFNTCALLAGVNHQ